jgi:hypothetical protein
MGAHPIGAPGWPELAFWTTSAACGTNKAVSLGGEKYANQDTNSVDALLIQFGANVRSKARTLGGRH